MHSTRLAPTFALVLTLLAAPAAGRVPQDLASTAGVHSTALHVGVHVVDGVATTTLKQTIRNDSRVAMAEAIWVLPLPEGAAVDGFEMKVDGVKMTGEVLGADGARRVYEDIVRRRLDPGLLEYMGRGCLRARVFPIPSGKSIDVEISYRHILPRLANLTRWSLPVRAAGVDGRAPDRVTLDVTIESKRAIKNAFSPTPQLEVLQPDDHTVRASFEGVGSSLPREELALLFGLSERDFGLDLLTHRAAGEDEGTFLMLLSPKRSWGENIITKKDITFVVDTSGSMAGDKIKQAKASLLFFLKSLNPGDRFNVVPFSTEPRPFFPGPVEVTEGNVAHAIKSVRRINATGGTNIAEALRVSLTASAQGDADEERLTMVLFLTDGVPTVGTTEIRDILKGTERANVGAARIFVLGVGHDVNTHLLDRLAADTRGARDYVQPGADIEMQASAMLAKVSNPVLTDLQLEVEGVRISRTVPARLGDLFEGDRLEVFGRYTGNGPSAIRLRGRFRGTEREYVYEGTFTEKPVDQLSFLGRLWAERRVGVLLDAIRLNGADAELVAEVTRLGQAFQIVTPYTSHLILEPGMERAAGDGPLTSGDGFFLGRGNNAPAAARAPAGLRALGYADSTGESAVEQSQYLRDMIAGTGLPREQEQAVRRVKDKVFRLEQGVWTDQAFGESTILTRTTVEAFSTEYFDLLRTHSDLKHFFAIGPRVIVVLQDRVIEVVPRVE